MRPVIFPDQGEGQIDAGAESARGVERAVLHERSFVSDLQPRKSPRDIAGDAPVRRDFATVEQPGRSHSRRCRCKRRRCAGSRRAFEQPASDDCIDRSRANAAAARDDDAVEVGRGLEGCVGGECDAGFGLEAFFRRRRACRLRSRQSGRRSHHPESRQRTRRPRRRGARPSRRRSRRGRCVSVS